MPVTFGITAGDISDTMCQNVLFSFHSARSGEIDPEEAARLHFTARRLATELDLHAQVKGASGEIHFPSRFSSSTDELSNFKQSIPENAMFSVFAEDVIGNGPKLGHGALRGRTRSDTRTAKRPGAVILNTSTLKMQLIQSDQRTGANCCRNERSHE